MPVRKAEASWTAKSKSGTVKLGSGAFEGKYSFGSRFENEPGTNPEELIGAAHAGCFSMALALFLEKAGHAPENIQTGSKVHIEKQGEGFAITRIELDTTALVPDIDEATFRKHAESAKINCPVSKALAGAEITLKATLKKS